MATGTEVRRGRRRLAGLVTVLGLAAAACGGGEGSGGDENVFDDTTTTTVQLGDPVRGGELTVGLEAETNSWLPGQGQFASSGLNVGYALYDPLVARGADGDMHPFLAESFSANDDVTEWTFKLREGITFHDGTALTAEVVKANFDEYLTAETSNLRGGLEQVVELRVDDPLTFTYVLAEPNAGFITLLETPEGWPFSIEAARAAGDDAGSRPVGTGPFMFDSWTRDDRIVLKRNPNYWRDGLPYVDTLVFRPIVEEDSRVASLQSGDVDAMTSLRGSTIKTARAAAEDGSFITHLRLSNESNGALLNTLEPPFDDVRARKAFVHMLNPDDVAEVLGDDGLVEPSTQWFSPDSPWHSEEVAEAWPKYDEAAAKELVDDYRNDPERSDGKEPGDPLEFEFACPPDPTLLLVSELAKAQGEKVGIDVSIRQVEQATHIARAIGSPETDPPYRGDYQVNCFRWGDERDPSVTLGQAFGHPDTQPQNFTNYWNEEIDGLLRDLRTTREFEDRKEIVEQIGLLLAEDVPYAFATGTPTMIAARSEVKNIPGWTVPDGAKGDGTPRAVTRWAEVWIDEEG